MNTKTIIFSLLIRIILIYVLSNYENPNKITLTDIDYKVFTEAANHVLNS
jgi:hypothetical protein